MSTQEKNIKKSDFLKVLLTAIIVEDGFNVREDMGDIDALAKSFAAQGQKQPLKGRRVGDTIVLTAGHRRLAAMKLANEKYGATIMRADVITDKSSDQDRVLEMLLDGEGAKSLTNSEMVTGIDRLIAMGMKKKDIIASLVFGDSQAQKYNLVKAAEAPQELKDFLAAGEISVAKVNALQRQAGSDEELIELATQFVADKKEGKTAPKVNATIAKLEDVLSLAGKTTKAIVLKAIINRLKSGASAEEIAKLLK